MIKTTTHLPHEPWRVFCAAKFFGTGLKTLYGVLIAIFLITVCSPSIANDHISFWAPNTKQEGDLSIPKGTLTITQWNVIRFTKWYENINATGEISKLYQNKTLTDRDHEKEAFLQQIAHCKSPEIIGSDKNALSDCNEWDKETTKYALNSYYYAGTGLGWTDNYMYSASAPFAIGYNVTDPNYYELGNQKFSVSYQDKNNFRTDWYYPFLKLNSDIISLDEIGMDPQVPPLFTDLGYNFIMYMGANANIYGNLQGRYPTGLAVRDIHDKDPTQKNTIYIEYSVNLMGFDRQQGSYTLADGDYGNYGNHVSGIGQPFYYPQGFAVINYKGAHIAIFTVQLKDGNTQADCKARHDEIDRLVGYINSVKKTYKHIIVMGDFNDQDDDDSSFTSNQDKNSCATNYNPGNGANPEVQPTQGKSYLYALMAQIPMKSAREKGSNTYTDGGDKVFNDDIDHIFVSDDLYEAIKKVEVVNGMGFGVYPDNAMTNKMGKFWWSDHMPVKVTFDFK